VTGRAMMAAVLLAIPEGAADDVGSPPAGPSDSAPGQRGTVPVTPMDAGDPPHGMDVPASGPGNRISRKRPPNLGHTPMRSGPEGLPGHEGGSSLRT
jgi:hypothetical protein